MATCLYFCIWMHITPTTKAISAAKYFAQCNGSQPIHSVWTYPKVTLLLCEWMCGQVCICVCPTQCGFSKFKLKGGKMLRLWSSWETHQTSIKPLLYWQGRCASVVIASCPGDMAYRYFHSYMHSQRKAIFLEMNVQLRNRPGPSMPFLFSWAAGDSIRNLGNGPLTQQMEFHLV